MTAKNLSVVPVREAEARRDVRRQDGARWVAKLPMRERQRRLLAVRRSIERDSRKTYKQRDGRAFTTLTPFQLAILEDQMGEYVKRGRLKILDDSPLIKSWLDPLRLNLLVGKTVVSCADFRRFASTLLVLTSTFVMAMLGTTAEDVTVVLPWRAALLCGEVWYKLGMAASRFWHLGIKRDEKTLQPIIYYERKSRSRRRTTFYIVSDPMVATGRTSAVAVQRLVDSGVPVEQIIVRCIVAAPAGVDYLLHRFDGLRIVTAALDECLNSAGYIIGVGLGDFGDLAWADLTIAYAKKHWVKTGITTLSMARRILKRTREVAEEQAAA